MQITDFLDRKRNQKKIKMITCYDAVFADLINRTSIDAVLVGDSAAMVVHGFDSTLSATVELMQLHTASVARKLKGKLIVGDLPFLSYRRGFDQNVQAVQMLMQAGAHAVKLEGAAGNLEFIQHLVSSGVPVMGHLGLTPQFVNLLGGYKVQGKSEVGKKQILESAKQLQDSGCFSIVLECVPAPLAKEITESLSIPTIGIGAGPATDGQILVLHDLLGLNSGHKAKFVRQYVDGFRIFGDAIENYCRDVESTAYPSPEESYL